MADEIEAKMRLKAGGSKESVRGSSSTISQYQGLQSQTQVGVASSIQLSQGIQRKSLTEIGGGGANSSMSNNENFLLDGSSTGGTGEDNPNKGATSTAVSSGAGARCGA